MSYSNEPPYNAPPPPPAYGGGYGGSPYGQPPANGLVWAILTTVLCCMPLGIVSNQTHPASALIAHQACERSVRLYLDPLSTIRAAHIEVAALFTRETAAHRRGPRGIRAGRLVGFVGRAGFGFSASRADEPELVEFLTQFRHQIRMRLD